MRPARQGPARDRAPGEGDGGTRGPWADPRPATGQEVADPAHRRARVGAGRRPMATRLWKALVGTLSFGATDPPVLHHHRTGRGRVVQGRPACRALPARARPTTLRRHNSRTADRRPRRGQGPPGHRRRFARLLCGLPRSRSGSLCCARARPRRTSRRLDATTREGPGGGRHHGAPRAGAGRVRRRVRRPVRSRSSASCAAGCGLPAGEFRVVKMTLARRAADELGRPAFKSLLGGPGRPGLRLRRPRRHRPPAARLRPRPRPSAGQGGAVRAEVIPPERVSALAELEPRPVLLARVAGALQAPLTAMAGVLAAVPRGLATVLGALAEKKPALRRRPREAAPEAAPRPPPTLPTETAARDRNRRIWQRGGGGRRATGRGGRDRRGRQGRGGMNPRWPPS